MNCFPVSPSGICDDSILAAGEPVREFITMDYRWGFSTSVIGLSSTQPLPAQKAPMFASRMLGSWKVAA